MSSQDDLRRAATEAANALDAIGQATQASVRSVRHAIAALQAKLDSLRDKQIQVNTQPQGAVRRAPVHIHMDENGCRPLTGYLDDNYQANKDRDDPWTDSA